MCLVRWWELLVFIHSARSLKDEFVSTCQWSHQAHTHDKDGNATGENKNFSYPAARRAKIASRAPRLLCAAVYHKRTYMPTNNKKDICLISHRQVCRVCRVPCSQCAASSRIVAFQVEQIIIALLLLLLLSWSAVSAGCCAWAS